MPVQLQKVQIQPKSKYFEIRLSQPRSFENFGGGSVGYQKITEDNLKREPPRRGGRVPMTNAEVEFQPQTRRSSDADLVFQCQTRRSSDADLGPLSDADLS